MIKTVFVNTKFIVINSMLLNIDIYLVNSKAIIVYYRIILIFLFLGSSLTTKAQDYLPFPDSNAIWINHHVDYEIQFPNPIPVITSESYTRYCAPGIDTTINALNYSKIFYCGGAYKGAIRQELGKVYFIPTDSINELLLYDFTVELQDELSVYSEAFDNEWFESSLTVEGLDSVLINGLYRKRIYFSGSQWIEGIGNTFGLFNESWINVSNYFNNLSCFSMNDTTLYPEEGLGACALNVGLEEVYLLAASFRVFPNPSKGIFTLESDFILEAEDIVLINTLGEIIQVSYDKTDQGFRFDLSAFPKGLYFLRILYHSELITKKLVME
jgi:hypothetical protein